MSLKILLVDPPCQTFTGYYRFYFPGGLASIAACLQEEGHEVLIADLEHRTENISKSFVDNIQAYSKYLEGLKEHPIWEKYSKTLEEFQPTLVGITTVTPKVASVLKLASITKQISPTTSIVVGGNHVTPRPQDLLRDKNIEYAIRGEGEKVMLELVKLLADKNDDFHKVKGLSFRTNDKIINNPVQKPIVDLDSLPLPARTALMNLSTYRPLDLGMISTSRGCQYSCTFCDVPVQWRKPVRFRSIDNVLQEILDVKTEFNTNYFSFRDSTFTFDRNRTIALCESIKKEAPGICWECLTKPNHVDSELISIMQEAGCRKIRIGIESGSPEIVKYMKKKVSLDDVKKAALTLNAAEMDWSAYFMLGVPAETAESMDQTFNLMQEIDPPFISLTRYVPMPGSKMFEEVVKTGLLDPDKTDWTWALNQSLDQVFVTKMDPELFKEKMTEIAIYVRNHNDKKGSKDYRLKV